jgi:alpha-D-xyloside xylohydrolase
VPTRAIFSLASLLTLVLIACSAPAAYEQTADGIVVTPQGGSAKKVRLQVVSDRVIRVTAFATEALTEPTNLIAVKSDGGANFTVEQKDDSVVLTTGAIAAAVSLKSGRVEFRDKDGKVILAELENGRGFDATKIEGKSFYAIRQQFESPTDEAFYGLGQHQEGEMNFKGKDVELAQHNMDVGIPFVLSTRNYGVLWDNNSITRFGDPRPWQPLSKTLKLYDADGKEGSLTGKYYVNGALKLTRAEKDLDYQYIKSLAANFPPEFKGVKVKVVFEGKVEALTPGKHKFTLYASNYHKLFVDDANLIDAWRQNWNPWYRDFTLDLTPGKPRAIRIEWEGADGYLTLQHRDPLPGNEQNNLSLYSELAQAIDYYFVTGANADEVIAGYRRVTGKATLVPRWVYGFWQSRQRYETQEQTLGVVDEYRKRGIPIDNIVQDWFYWKEDSWGSHQFDPARFPDPKGMVDAIHKQNAHVMISVWPKFYPDTDNFKELDAKGHIYRRNLEQHAKDWVGPGYESSFYDPYSDEARAIYWRQIDERLNKFGFDAWWLDASEPDPHSNLDIEERKLRMGPTAMGPGAEFFNSYALMHARGVYEGDRAADPDQRTFILTRSAFAGLQRYAAATWSGDVAARWSDLGDQIAAGINFSLSGLPNWTTDIGGYAVEERYIKPNAQDLAEWRELNTRWFEFGAFMPLFRLHGEAVHREIYNLAPRGSETYETLVGFDKLRYRLMPYIYAVAQDTWHRDSTMMRGLIMDFAADPAVRNIRDQYLFGPAFLVSPVHEYKARSRQLYLPAGTRWYEFFTGEAQDGGQTITAAAPLNRLPLYVRAGAIVPVGPAIEYTGQKPEEPLTLFVYTGANGTFDLYEDDGLSYGYEKGEFSRIALRYDDAKGELEIGARTGSFSGMVSARQFRVRWMSAGTATASTLDAPADETVNYDGTAVSIKRRTQH